MKKLISIVLALVLVLAIAAPAMAITGYVSPVTSSTASGPYAMDLYLVTDDAAGLGLLGLSAIASSKAYVMNEVVYGRIDVAANDADDITWDPYDYDNTYLVISSNAVALQNAVIYSVESGSSSVLLSGSNGSVTQVGNAVADSDNVISMNLGGTPVDTITLFVGVVQAQGSIVAELRGGNKQYFEGIDGVVSTNPHYIFDDLGELLYSYKANGNDVIVTVYDEDNAGEVTFVRNSDDECTAIIVYSTTYGTYTFQKAQAISSTLADCFVGASVTYTSLDSDLTAYNELRAIYDSVMNFFGFDYDAEGELLDAHFTSKLHSFYAVDTVAVNLYTSAITITTPDADVEIPQTGDAATTIGFVMVALAIVAAAAAAYRKVRA